ncbi:hypothetical protein LCGC14_1559300 [marine sediment metagenome]|uniref:Uncharacterized protein n=1 Tax=marine sediment metagenome TaxID=412755 RepID=A0A0F9LNQ6_9ZZZZ
MARGQSRALIVIVLLAVTGLIVFGLLRRGGRSDPPKQPTPPTAAIAPAPRAAGPTTATSAPPIGRTTKPAPPKPAERVPALLLLGPTRQVTPQQRTAAEAMARRGLKLAADNKAIEARSTLADALNSGALATETAGKVRQRLAALAKLTLLGPKLYRGDPCTFAYRFKPGDVLVRLERKLGLHVPERLIMSVNGIADATKIWAGQNVKMIRGPFHAVVSKSRFTMDLYLAEPGAGRMIFIRRLRVGTGKDGSTPTGMWQVSPGRKMIHAPWTPPPSSKLPPRKILWGQPGYPLGAKGYWIGLEGTAGNIRTAEDGYGLHGTNDLGSIGEASSMGCIRLTDTDIELVYATLYPKWSKVRIDP